MIERIKAALDEMTRSERQVAACFLADRNDFAFGTLDAVAQKARTSTTSVLRFCRRLGFAGYKDLQEAVREEMKYRPQLPDKFRRTVDEHIPDALLARTLRQGIDCIQRTFQELSPEQFGRAAARIAGADRVFTFGMKESFALAHYAYTRFATVRKDVYMLDAGYNGQIEPLLSLRKRDVCLVFLFHRYTKQAVQVLCMLRKQGVPLILVTDSPYEDLEQEGHIQLLCQVDAGGIKNTSLAPVCLLDGLCGAVAAELGDKALQYMKDSETLFREAAVLE